MPTANVKRPVAEFDADLIPYDARNAALKFIQGMGLGTPADAEAQDISPMAPAFNIQPQLINPTDPKALMAKIGV